MQRLQSILPVQKTFSTGNKPILVTASDGNDYVAKACREKPPSFRLLKEVLGSIFCRKWGIATPNPILIDIDPEHLQTENFSGNTELYNFPCFASAFNNEADDWDNLLKYTKTPKRLPPEERKFLLKITLLDIWLGNEDRDYKNHNLLLLPRNYSPRIQAIDFEAIFNSLDSNFNTIHMNTAIDNPDTTILSSDSVKAQLSRSRNLSDWVLELKDMFPTFVNDCSKVSDLTLGKLPKEWQIRPKDIGSWLDENLFSTTRVTQSWSFFERQVQKHLNS